MAKAKYMALPFPLAGWNKKTGYQQQPPFTSPDMNNVRHYDTLEGRDRGGSRPGLQKAWAQDLGSKVNAAASFQYLSGGSIVYSFIAIGAGQLYYDNSGTMTSAGSAVFGTTGALQVADRGGKLYIADDSNQAYVYTPPSTLATLTSTDSAGTSPTDARCVQLWRDRIVLAGGPTNPHVWTMSRQGDPTDWDVAQTDVGAAILGSNTKAGDLADPITAIVAHNDDCMIMFGENSAWTLRGDPSYGGQIDNLSHNIGCVDNLAWCHTSMGELVFLSNDGIYWMPPGCGDTPRPFSRLVTPEELLHLDTSSYTATMSYDVRDRGVHLFVSHNSSTSGSHYFIAWDDNKGIFPLTLQNDHDPFCCFDHHPKASSTDSGVILGCRDGYLRQFAHDIAQDDGSDITSYVYYGPFQIGSNRQDGMVAEIIGETGGSSGDVDCSVHVADTPRAAVTAAAHSTHQWNTAGLNHVDYPRARGGAFCLKLANGASNERWSVESVEAKVVGLGRKRVA